MEETKEMLSLIVRAENGVLVQNNFEEFKESSLALIRSGNKDLVTDQDFADAKKTIKDCSLAETRVANAIQSFEHSPEVATLKNALAEFGDEARKTRLALEKKVKEEELKRKNTLVQDGLDKILGVKNSSPAGHGYIIDADLVRNAVKGKSSKSSMEEAINKVVTAEIGKINDLTERYMINMDAIGKNEESYHGLFPDKKAICLQSPESVILIIDSRINKFKLDKKEKEEREAAALKAKEEPEAAAKLAEENRLAERKTEEVFNAAPQTIIEPPPVAIPTSKFTLPPSGGFSEIPQKTKEQFYRLTVVVLTEDLPGMIKTLNNTLGVHQVIQ